MVYLLRVRYSMNVQRTAPAAFTAEFENEQELRDEHRVNLSFGALRLLTAESIALHTALLVTLRGPWAGEINVRATVVAVLADGIALAIEGNPDEILARLLARPAVAVAEAVDTAAEEEEPPEKSQNTWDRMRNLSQ